MSVVSYALDYLSMVKGEVDKSKFIEIEDCGMISPSLSGYHLVFNKDDYGRFEQLYVQGVPEDSKESIMISLRSNFEINPVDAISFLAIQEGKKFTTILMDHFGNYVEVLKAFGFEVEMQKVSDEDNLLDMDEEDESFMEEEDNIDNDAFVEKEETSVSNYTEEQEEQEMVADMEKKDNVVEAEVSVTIERLPQPQSEEVMNYNNLQQVNELLTTMERFSKLASSNPNFRDTFFAMSSMLGRSNIQPIQEQLTDEQFNMAMEIFEKKDSSWLARTTIIVLKRLWRIGDRETVNRFVVEVIYQFEEERSR